MFQSLEDEAHARIIWGEEPAAVQEWLCRKGLDRLEAKAIVEESVRERELEVRKSGLKSIAIGAGLMAGCALVVFAQEYLMVFGSVRVRIGLLYSVACLLGAFGLYRLITGLLRLVSGVEPGAVSDLD